MGILRDRMEADLKIGNYSPATRKHYLRYAKRFAAYHQRSPAEMGHDEIRQWLLHLVEDLHLGPESIRLARASLMFLYRVTLGHDLALERIPVPRKGKRVPVVLSGSEVERLVDLFTNAKYRAIVMAMYGGGLRISEACGLRPEHIDSKRMLLHLRGKGDAERYTLLSERLLEHLREYWLCQRPQNGWLFPGRGKQGHISPTTVGNAFTQVVKTAGFTKRVTPHTLRHSFATHLIETGTDASVVKVLLGHRHLQTTEVYLHASTKQLSRTISPLDLLGTPVARVLG